MLNLLKHPLLTHKLTLLRLKDTSTKDFRETLGEIAGLMSIMILYHPGSSVMKPYQWGILYILNNRNFNYSSISCNN
jgi:hypothetical protein